MRWASDAADDHGGEVADVRLYHAEAGALVPGSEPGEIPVAAGPREVVRHGDGLPSAEESIGEVAADEPGSARHQVRG
jgi:hypothetical protein